MYVIVAEFTIKPEAVERFGRMIDRQAQESLELEADCHQFDVCQDENDPSKFLFYEIFTDKAAFEKHRSLPHTVKFLAEAGSMTAERVIRSFKRRER